MTFRLRDLSKRTKIVVAILLFFMFVSESLALIHYNTRIGHGNETAYFAGNESEELSDDAILYYPKSLQELLDVAHPHSFGFTLYFALVAFLWTGIEIKRPWWALWLAGFSVCMLGFMAAPFIIRYLIPGASGLFAVFGAGLTAHLYVFIALASLELRQSAGANIIDDTA